MYMFRKIIKTKYNLYLIVFLLLTCNVKAQNTTNSIYSRGGYGLETFKGFSSQMALGGSGIASNNPWNLNYSNPASNAALRLTVFTAGINGMYKQQLNFADTVSEMNGSFGYIALGFPVTKWWGLSFGLIPYTGVGYNVKDTVAYAKQNIAGTYKGSGGLNKLYLANGLNPFKIFSDSIMRGFSVGFNTEFTFGSINNEEYRDFLGSDTTYYLNILNNTYHSYNGVSFLIGAQHSINIKDDTKLTLGFSYGLKGRLNTQSTLSSERYFRTSSASNKVDTAYYLNSQKTIGYLPSQYCFGFNVQMGPKINYTLEYKVVKWGKDSISGNLNNLKDSRIIAAGIQYYPNSQSPDGFFNHAYYRLGFKNTVMPFYLNNLQIQEHALTAGIGIPFRKSVSTVNIGIELGRRGTVLDKMVKEKYILLNVGLSINDRWFIKSKYD